jgi:magnesium-transporting ATPase (P-type)
MISALNKPPRQKTTAKPKGSSISVSPILMELAHAENSDVFAKLKTSSNGLSCAAVEARTVEYGPNDVAIEKQGGWLSRLFKATRNLLVILLAILATVSFRNGRF